MYQQQRKPWRSQPRNATRNRMTNHDSTSTKDFLDMCKRNLNLKTEQVFRDDNQFISKAAYILTSNIFNLNQTGMLNYLTTDNHS